MWKSSPTSPRSPIPRQKHGKFKDSLDIHLNYLSASVLAEHDREVQRLKQIIEGLKKKLCKTPASLCHPNPAADPMQRVGSGSYNTLSISMDLLSVAPAAPPPLPHVIEPPPGPAPIAIAQHHDRPEQVAGSPANSVAVCETCGQDGEKNEGDTDYSDNQSDCSGSEAFAGHTSEVSATDDSLTDSARHKDLVANSQTPGSHGGTLLGAGKRRFSNGLRESYRAFLSALQPAPRPKVSLCSQVVTTQISTGGSGPPSQRGQLCDIAEDSFRLAPVWHIPVKSSSFSKSKRHHSNEFRNPQNFTPTFSAESSISEPGSTGNCLARSLQYIMVQPSSIKYVAWNMCGLAFIMYDAVMVPLEIFSLPDMVFLKVMVALSTIFWTLDIVGNFITGYMNADGSVTMMPAAVAFKYASSWLLFDAVMALCNWVVLCDPDDSQEGGIHGLNAWRMVTLLRWLRILRLLKGPEIEGFISEHIRSETTRLVFSIARLIILLVIVAHIIACLWYGVGHYVAHQGSHSSWVARYNSAYKSAWDNYAISLQWSLSQFAGEQIIELESLPERSLAIVIFIFAFLFSSIFVSSITTLMTRLQIIASKQSGQLSALRRYLYDNDISMSLAVRIYRNAQQSMRTNQRVVALDSVEVLREVSQSLQVELHFEVHFPTISHHPFFKCYYRVNSIGIQKLCHQAVSDFWVSSAEVVFHECETPETPSMYFVAQGELVYQQEGLQKSNHLSRGKWACEMALWVAAVQHYGTMTVKTESSLLRLEADKFQRIVQNFPTDHARDYAKQFVSKMRLRSKEANFEFTDVPEMYADQLCEEIFPEFYCPQLDSSHSFMQASGQVSSWVGRVVSRRSQVSRPSAKAAEHFAGA